MYDILIVEDNEMNARSLERVLVKEGYNVTVANDGEQALSHLRGLQFHLMVTDLTMPKVSGIELIEHVKGADHLKDMPIIVLSSLTGEALMKACYGLGIDNYLIKPVSATELVVKIKRTLQANEAE
ncbi:MAG: response regulator [Chitinophagia bacterium]|nr:response regulator [Chitinophagia bacterium]